MNYEDVPKKRVSKKADLTSSQMNLKDYDESKNYENNDHVLAENEGNAVQDAVTISIIN